MPRFAAVLALSVLFLAPATLSAAPPANPSDVHVLIDPASSPLFEIEVIEAKPHLGRDFEILFRIRNLGTETLENVEIAIEQRSSKGRTRAYESSLKWTRLASGDEFYIGRLSDHFQPRPGDSFLISAQPYEGPNPSAPLSNGEDWQKVGISQCTSFCNRCSEKALATCSGGVAEYECECGDSTTICRVKCRV